MTTFPATALQLMYGLALNALMFRSSLVVLAGIPKQSTANSDAIRRCTDRIEYGVAAVIVGSSWIVLCVTLGGLLGALDSRAEMFALGLGLTLAVELATGWARRSGRAAAFTHLRFPTPSDPPRNHGRAIALAVAALLFAWILLLCERITLPPVAWDALTYHLRFPALWFQTGHLTTSISALGDSSHTYYPLVGEMLLYWGMLTTGTDLWSSISQAPFALAAACGIAWFSIRSGARASIAVLAAIAWLATPGLLRQSAEAMTDIEVAGFFVLAVLFAVRYGEQRERCWFFLLAASLGLLIGTKYTGLIYALAAAPFVISMVGSRPSGEKDDRLSVGTLLAGLGLVLLLGGFAYARNLAASGNPLLPMRLTIGGTTLLHGPLTADYFYGGGTNRLGWRALLLSPRMLLEMGPAFPILLAVLPVGHILSLRSRFSAAPNRLIAWLAVTAMLGFLAAGAALPFREHRYFYGVTALAWCVAAVLASPTSVVAIPRRAIVILLLLQIPLTLFYWGKDLAAVGPNWGHLLAAIIILTLGLCVLIRSRLRTVLQKMFGPWRNGTRFPRALLASSAAVVGIVMLVGTLFYERNKFEMWRSYWGTRHEWGNLRKVRPDLREMARTWAFLADLTRDKPAVIGYSGMNIPYPLYGYGLRNRVIFVPHNEDETASGFDWGMSLPDPLTGGTEEKWIHNIMELHVQFLCAFRMRDNHGDADFPIEQVWADRNPEIFTLIQDLRYARIYRVSQ